jgi:hypothetical protein
MHLEFERAFELLETLEQNREDLMRRREMNESGTAPDLIEPPRRPIMPDATPRRSFVPDEAANRWVRQHLDQFQSDLVEIIGDAMGALRLEERDATDKVIAALEAEIEQLRAEVRGEIVALPRGSWKQNESESSDGAA